MLEFNCINEEEFQVLIDQAPILIWRANVNAECDYFNSRWLQFTGRGLEQELGNGWAQGVHKDDFEMCIAIYKDSFKRREQFEITYRLLLYDGCYRWILDRGTPYFSVDGRFKGYIGSCIDITERVISDLEKQEIYKATVSSAQHVLYNMLNQLKLVELELVELGLHTQKGNLGELLSDICIEGKELVDALSAVDVMDPKEILKSVYPKC